MIDLIAKSSYLVEVVQDKTGGRRGDYRIDACRANSIFRDIPALIRKQARECYSTGLFASYQLK